MTLRILPVLWISFSPLHFFCTSSSARSSGGGERVALAVMKYSYQNLVSQYTRPSTYTPTHYTPTHYTPKQYSTSSYSTSYYSPEKYTPTYYTPPAYTSAYKSTSSSYKPVYNKASQYVSNQSTPVHQTSVVTRKPARTVRFTNDVIFQDHVRHGDLEMVGRFMRARKVRVDTIFHSGKQASHFFFYQY